ncbi:unnamed protein product, partial [Mesorhabditis spiculigera]
MFASRALSNAARTVTETTYTYSRAMPQTKVPMTETIQPTTLNQTRNAFVDSFNFTPKTETTFSKTSQPTHRFNPFMTKQ